MHNLIPHFIQEQFSQGDYWGKFSAASLFIDISGFTTITNTLMEHGPHGAEVLAAIMRRVLDPPIRDVYEKGGFIVGLAGDAFTALFPHDEAKNDVCWQALAAAFGPLLMVSVTSEPRSTGVPSAGSVLTASPSATLAL